MESGAQVEEGRGASAGKRGKKKAVGKGQRKNWSVLAVGKDGTCEMLRCDKHSIMLRTGIPLRDLRLHGPLLSHAAAILGRENCFIVNLEFVHAIITAEEALLFNPNEADVIKFASQLQRVIRAPQGSALEGLHPAKATTGVSGRSSKKDLAGSSEDLRGQDGAANAASHGPGNTSSAAARPRNIPQLGKQLAAKKLEFAEAEWSRVEEAQGSRLQGRLQPGTGVMQRTGTEGGYPGGAPGVRRGAKSGDGGKGSGQEDASGGKGSGQEDASGAGVPLAAGRGQARGQGTGGQAGLTGQGSASVEGVGPRDKGAAAYPNQRGHVGQGAAQDERGHVGQGAAQEHADGEEELPFEFRVLESILEVSIGKLEGEWKQVQGVAYPALDQLSRRVTTSALELVRTIKTRMTHLASRVQRVRVELEQLLDDDQDMADLYLTRRLHWLRLPASPSSSVCPSARASLARQGNAPTPGPGLVEKGSFSGFGTVSQASTGAGKDVEECEMLLESYFMQVDGVLNELTALHEYVDDTEDYVNIHLDYRRNQLQGMNILFTAAGAILSMALVILGLFSMNIPFYLNDVDGVFTEFVWTLLGVCAFLFGAFLYYAWHNQMLVL